MLQKLSDLTLDVIGVCAFGYNFDGILGGSSEEGRATNTILTANFNVIRKLLEQLIPLLKLIPSKERDELKKAEDVFYGLIKKVCTCRPYHSIMGRFFIGVLDVTLPIVCLLLVNHFFIQ